MDFLILWLLRIMAMRRKGDVYGERNPVFVTKQLLLAPRNELGMKIVQFFVLGKVFESVKLSFSSWFVCKISKAELRLRLRPGLARWTLRIGEHHPIFHRSCQGCWQGDPNDERQADGDGLPSAHP